MAYLYTYENYTHCILTIIYLICIELGRRFSKSNSTKLYSLLAQKIQQRAKNYILSGPCGHNTTCLLFLQLVFAKDVHVKFQLLDVAPAHGDGKTRPKETTLDQASTLLKHAINGGMLVIPLVWHTVDDVSSLPLLILV